MKPLPTAIAAILCVAITGTVYGQPPSDLLGWLKMLDDDNYRLISAIDQNGYWFAVRIDSQGDILFSGHEHHDEKNDGECVLRVQDAHGNDLHDLTSKKRNPESIEIVSKRQVEVGNIFTETEFTHTYPAGTIYPLKARESKTIVVIYSRLYKDGTKTELFRQRLVLPNAG